MIATPQIYVKGSLEAVVLYQKAFNLTPGMTAYLDNGAYEHVSLMSGENEIIAIAEDALDLHSDKIVGDKISVMAFNLVGLGTREAVDNAYFLLSAEARINENPNGPEAPYWNKDKTEYWFSLVDKFGVYWAVAK